MSVNPPFPYSPTVADVASVLRARTKDIHGNEFSEFNEETRPSDTEVEKMIGMAASHLISRYGPDVPQSHHTSVNFVTSLLAAKLIELSYFPEQINTERSPYIQLNALYMEMLEQLDESLAEEMPVPGEGPGYPVWFFQQPYLVGWESIW